MIEINGLTKRYGGYVALDAVSLSVREGEFLALLGPSGCGKTTLLRSIAGFVSPDGGAISIDGQHMSKTPPNKRPVNTVFQNYALFPHYTVRDNVAFGPRRQGMPAREIADSVDLALEAVGMAAFAERFPSQLSGGQQQRVALARAIVNRPKVLLLDEPLGALDLKLRKQLQVELSRLHKALGMTFIFVTHDQEEALTMADRVAVMKSGSIVQIGKPADIYNRPNCRYVADFVGDSNFLRARRSASGDAILIDAIEREAMDAATTDDRACSVLIRPENIETGERRSAGEIEAAGKVQSVMFVGGHYRIEIELRDGELLQLHVPGTEAPPAKDDMLTVHWAAGKSTVMRD